MYVNSKLLHVLSKKVDVNISTEDNQLPQQMIPLESEADMEKNGRTSSRQRCLCQKGEQRSMNNSFKIIVNQNRF